MNIGKNRIQRGDIKQIEEEKKREEANPTVNREEITKSVRCRERMDVASENQGENTQEKGAIQTWSGTQPQMMKMNINPEVAQDK
jgi:hypothetical protein